MNFNCLVIYTNIYIYIYIRSSFKTRFEFEVSITDFKIAWLNLGREQFMSQKAHAAEGLSLTRSLALVNKA